MIFVWILCENVSELMIRLSFVRKYGLNLGEDNGQVLGPSTGKRGGTRGRQGWCDRGPGVDGCRSEGKTGLV